MLHTCKSLLLVSGFAFQKKKKKMYWLLSFLSQTALVSRLLAVLESLTREVIELSASIFLPERIREESFNLIKF